METPLQTPDEQLQQAAAKRAEILNQTVLIEDQQPIVTEAGLFEMLGRQQATTAAQALYISQLQTEIRILRKSLADRPA